MKLFINGDRRLVSDWVMRQIDKGYEIETIKDNGVNVAVVVTKESS